jgi:type I restriction enzyme S subunit
LEHIESRKNRLVGIGIASDTTSTKTRFRAGDVLYGKLRPYLNKVVSPEFDGVCSTDILVFPQSNAIVSSLLLRFLSQAPVVEFAAANASGINLPRVSFETLAGIPLPLPPIAEQKRIVASVDQLQARSRATRAVLDLIPPLLEQFRQSVLAAAFRGDLTADWRNLERAENMRHIELGADSLPSGWQNCLIGELTDSSFYGPRFGADEYCADGIPTIRTTDMGRTGRIVPAAPPRVRITDEKLEKQELRDGDLLITRTGSIGRCAVFDATYGRALPSAYLIRFRLHRQKVLPRYLLYFLLSPVGQRYMGAGATAVTQPNINARTISAISVPLPRLDEQQEIVRLVELALIRIGAVEETASLLASDVDLLNQSILAKAFRGELVPQDPSDEPASVLLERIRAEREAAGGGKRRGRK